MPTAKALGIKPKNSYPLDLSTMTMEELDIMYIGSDTDSPQRIQIANEIDKRVIKEEKGKKKVVSKSEDDEFEEMDDIAKAHETLGLGEFEKGQAVGTINAHGKQKQGDGTWKYVGKGGSKESSSLKDRQSKQASNRAQEPIGKRSEEKHVGKGPVGQKAVLKDIKDTKGAIARHHKSIGQYRDSAQGAEHFSKEIKEHEDKIKEHEAKLESHHRAAKNVGLVKGEEEFDLLKAEVIFADTTMDNFIKAKRAWNESSADPEKQKQIGLALDGFHKSLVDLEIQELNENPFWKK